MSEVILKKFHREMRGSVFQGMFTVEEFVGLLEENFGDSMLNVLIKSELGQGILIGYIIGKIDNEVEEEQNDSIDG